MTFSLLCEPVGLVNCFFICYGLAWSITNGSVSTLRLVAELIPDSELGTI